MENKYLGNYVIAGDYSQSVVQVGRDSIDVIGTDDIKKFRYEDIKKVKKNGRTSKNSICVGIAWKDGKFSVLFLEEQEYLNLISFIRRYRMAGRALSNQGGSLKNFARRILRSRQARFIRTNFLKKYFKKQQK